MTLIDTLTAAPLPLHTDRDGTVRVGGTRVPLDTVIGAYEDGATPEEIALQYDSLLLADIYAVIGHYLRHRAEVQEYLQRRSDLSQRIRRQNQARSPGQGVRERLLARRSASS